MARKLIGNRNGAAMAELAIILPILLIVLFGIIEFGLILYDKALITNASREGARAGIVYRDSAAGYNPVSIAEIEAVVNTYLDGGNRLIPPATPLTLSTTVPAICIQTVPPNPAFSLDVTVTYSYNFFVLPNFITSIIGPINLAGQTIMRCE